MSWATEEAAKISAAEQLLADDRKWQIHCAEVVKREAPGFFDRLTDQMEIYVSEFNAHRGSDIQFEKNQGVVSVTKSGSYPSRHIRLGLTDSVVSVFRRDTDSNSTAQNRDEFMRFSVQKDGAGILLDGLDHESVARRLLTPIFDAFRPR